MSRSMTTRWWCWRCWLGRLGFDRWDHVYHERRPGWQERIAAWTAPPGFVTQDEYAALLNRGRERIAQAFEWSTAAGTWHCRLCHRKAELVSVFHPIWDGPFDEGGSGVVDRRDFPWCVRCEALPPSPQGQPIRLPWLDQLPIRLRDELFERAAFHRLPVTVERFRPEFQTPPGTLPRRDVHLGPHPFDGPLAPPGPCTACGGPREHSIHT